MIQFISRTPSTCQSSISSLIAHNPRWSSIFIKILPFPPKSSPFQIASKERMISYSECFRPERIRDIRKIRLVWKAKKLDERGRRDYVRLCIHRVELKSERQPIRGLDQLERVPRWICIFEKGERGFSPLRSTRKAGPPPSREIGFPFRFPRFKSSRRDRGRGFPVSPREHRNDTSIRKKGPSLLASTLSLSLPLSSDRSFHPSPWNRDSALLFVYTQISAPPDSPDSGNSCPHGHRTTNIEYTASAASLERREISSYSDRVDIFPPKFSSGGPEFAAETWIN